MSISSPCEFLLVRPSTPAEPWELWLDWDMGLDGDLSTIGSVLSWRVEDSLLVRAPQEPQARHVGPFVESDWAGIIASGLILVICGPSGELARCPVHILPAPPACTTSLSDEHHTNF